MNELLDEVTQIPFDIFWEKYLEIGGKDESKTKGNAVWWMLNENQRAKAFTEICNFKTDLYCHEYLKRDYETT